MSIPEIRICMGSSCFSRGNAKNIEIVEKFLEAHGLKDEVDVSLCGGLCEGLCAEGPNVVINGKVYNRVDSGVMLDLLSQLFEKGGG
ncbi:MAG: (2Fe-2S) ferredoxin domain-containing protein [Planctomycetia bacterium]|nr:(2Fe-2S) ferredoxin domain-containing protein [Planctomycetia bacterium]